MMDAKSAYAFVAEQAAFHYANHYKRRQAQVKDSDKKMTEAEREKYMDELVCSLVK